MSSHMNESVNECGRGERRDAQRNLERVLEAAHQLFAERGSNVRMEEVAQRAGVGVGTIYRRFRSKEELYAAVTHSVCSDAHSSLQQAAHTECDSAGKLRALALVQYRRSAEQALLRDARAPQSGEAVFDQQQLQQALHQMLVEVIGAGQEEGTIRPGNTAVLAALCLELFTPHAFQQIQRLTPTEPEILAELAADFVLHALRPATAP